MKNDDKMEHIDFEDRKALNPNEYKFNEKEFVHIVEIENKLKEFTPKLIEIVVPY